MTAIINEKIEAVDLAQWTVKLGDNPLVIREQLDKAAKLVIAVKDFVSVQVSAEPHAAVAWAGVCVLLPVNPKSNHIDQVRGLIICL